MASAPRARPPTGERLHCCMRYAAERRPKARLTPTAGEAGFLSCWSGGVQLPVRRRQLLRRHQVCQDSLHCFCNAFLRRQGHSWLVCFERLEGFQL